MRTSLFILIIFCFGTGLYAQKTHYVDSTGKLYWNKSQPVYLFVSDNPEGSEAQKLESERTPEYANPLYLDTEGVNFIRTRDAVDPETKRVIPNKEIMFEIYADGIPPRTSEIFKEKARYQVDDRLFFDGGVKLSLESKDALSGLLGIVVSVNNSEFRKYKDTLSFSKSGRYLVRYYATDKVGNKEEIKELKIAVDAQAPQSKIKVEGIYSDTIAATTSSFYIMARDSLSGISKVYYKIDESNYRLYPKGKLPISNLGEGEHEIRYYAVDNVGNEEEENVFNFYLDRSPPLMVADVLGDRFIVDDQVYFSGRTKLKLTAVDNKVGVKEIMYSIDNQEFKPYTKPFYLPSVSGEHTVRYYSVDNLGNSSSGTSTSQIRERNRNFEEFKHNVSKVYVDLTGPFIDYQVTGYAFNRGDTLYIGPDTKIKLTGEDEESQLKEITYSINDELGETPYEGPFSLSLSGYNTISFYGYDNVNNRNVDKFSFFSDTDKPEIFIQFSTGEYDEKRDMPVYPENTGIFLSATDEIAGIAKLTYILDKDDEKNYSGLITGIKKGKHKIKVFATDVLNNTSEKEIEFFIK